MKVNNINEEVLRNLYLRKLALGEIQGPPTGYASVDKPWLKYYEEEHIKTELPHMTAYEYLKTLNKDNLDIQAIDSSMGNYTYKELFEMIERTAKGLYTAGIEKGDIVLTMLPVLPHESFILYGIDKIGGAMYPLPPQTPIEEICKTIRKTESKLFITFDYFLNSEYEKIIYEETNIDNIVSIGFNNSSYLDDRTITWDEFIDRAKDIEVPEIKRNPKDLLFFSSTGGSTGEPKSVMLNDDCFNIIVHQFINSDVNYNKGDKWIRLWPIFSASAAVSNHHLPLCTGGNDLLRSFPQNISDFDKMIYTEKPNHIIMIPQLIDVLEQSELLKNEDMSYIKTAGCGGLAITAQFEERVNKFYKEHNINTFIGYGWGCTENSSSVSMRSNFETTSIGTAGAPMVNTIVSVFDPVDGSEKKYGEEGELCINSETMMIGYYKDEELTKQTIRTHQDGSKWLHTGDLGAISKDGIITVKGRMTRMIFVFPTAKVYPQAMETTISKVDGVQEIVICQIPDEEHEGFFLPMCVVVPEKGYDEDKVKENVQTLCEVAFPEYAIPKKVYVRASLPLTKVGKTDVRALEAELQEERKWFNSLESHQPL